MESQLEGLPVYGVLLTGALENPVIENHSGKAVIAYVCMAADQNGYTSLNQPLLATSIEPGGIPDGGSHYAKGAMPINPPSLPGGLKIATLGGGFYSAPISRAGDFPPGPGPMVRATLRCVIFADGQWMYSLSGPISPARPKASSWVAAEEPVACEMIGLIAVQTPKPGGGLSEELGFIVDYR